MDRHFYGLLVIAFVASSVRSSLGQSTNINDIPNDLTVPRVTSGEPAAGKRVLETLPNYDGWQLQHVIYLPTDWVADRHFPVIVEYPGNGGYKNKLGDVSTGRVEDCKLGYGISGGKGFIWVCLPFVDSKTKQHTRKWWGDAEATAAYCRQAVKHIGQTYRGDLNRVILTGFSRGAIACGYIGLRDDETASLWRAMIVHSHYDGVRRWGYEGDDVEAAKKRLSRFSNRPQFVTQEQSVEDIRLFLANTAASTTLAPLPYPNHTDTWVLKDIPLRRQLRKWLYKTLEESDAKDGK